MAGQATVGLPATPPAECAALKALQLPDVSITESVAVPAPATGNIRVAHCRVNGTVGREIRFTLLLPNQWNGKFMMVGNGVHSASGRTRAMLASLRSFKRSAISGCSRL